MLDGAAIGRLVSSVDVFEYRSGGAEIEKDSRPASSLLAQIVIKGGVAVAASECRITLPAHFCRMLKFLGAWTKPELRREERSSHRGARTLQTSLGRNTHHAY